MGSPVIVVFLGLTPENFLAFVAGGLSWQGNIKRRPGSINEIKITSEARAERAQIGENARA